MWIVIPNWDRFQHYGDRQPPWIKLYNALLYDDDFQSLTAAERSALIAIWMLYATTRRRVRDDTANLTRASGQRITKKTLESLNRAGFIAFSASKPLALEVEVEKRTPPTPPQKRGGMREGEKTEGKPERNFRRYTGCRFVRGEYGVAHKHDPLGTDKPPTNWPHEAPSEAEIVKALEERAHA